MAKRYTLKGTYNTGLVKQIDETRFTINYAEELNRSQYQAVSAVEGAYLVIAGAGTGKTRTLVYRVARLVESGYAPESILLLTFTRKAAREMMNRASQLLDNRCAKVNGGTFHSFANLTLRKYGRAINLDPNFTILDQGDSEDIINLIRAQLNLEKLKKRFPNKKTIFKILSLSVNTEIPVEQILEFDYPHFFEFTDKVLDIQKVYKSYKRKNNLLDYDDLLLFLNEFLSGENAAKNSLLQKINFVMIDEFQDTNKIQAEIVKGLAQHKGNVMVVGDDSQSIYSFRGANFKNIMEFPKLFDNVKVIKLEENYRSTQEILNFTNHVISAALEKYSKRLYTKISGGEMPAIVSVTNENMQSRFIVERILELREEGIPLNEIAVLFRSSFFSFDLEIELNKANIPFVKFGGMKFIETAHVKDVLAFLRIAYNPRDVVSWYRVLLLHEGIGPKSAQKIIDIVLALGDKINLSKDLPTKGKFKDNVLDLFEALKKVSSNQHSLPSEKVEIALKYYDKLFRNKYDDFNKRKKDLEMFINISENYRSLDSFLSDMALEPPTDSVADVSATDSENEYLTLSTIHSAKGLEWHTVFIIHAMEGYFPSSQSLDKVETLEEERRLMYVASTRAKQNLYISYPMNIFDRQQGLTFSKPSRFIQDIGDDLAEEWLVEE
jgi:DNA helicase-2/ATP-dependent DNA helicase PcrA